MTKNPILLSILFFSISINAQEVSEEDIFQFRNLLKSKKFHDAEVLIERFYQLGMDEPKLELLETELWIEKADDLYSRKQYKSAFPYYNNAYIRWRTNPKIKERYDELAGKILVDEDTQANIRKMLKSNKNDETTVPSNIFSSKTMEFINSERIEILDNRVWNLSMLFSLSLLTNIIFFFR
ncbi:hypothetical protein LPTSP4_09700 [Leptospira ryugenii]|uniref:Tetratricopeptide repeat protein n=1 Tax=Leptospira ryugenii TaxID=1917863 RepID=A0A2P2DXV0_9LEPT|nr:hypothetical protein [Leptospira ryugenii]GBF49457.1 hypothetical protein LPTSP4_09700 [Leptospira ryugenii]